MKRIIYILILLLFTKLVNCQSDTVKVNFTTPNFLESLFGWNNLTNRTQGTTTSLNYVGGEDSGIDLYVTSSTIYSTEYGYYPGTYPDSVMRAAWRADGASSKIIQLQNLNTEKLYKIEILGSWNTGSTYNNQYTILDTTKQLDIYDNASNKVSWIIQPTSTSLDIVWTGYPNSYGFINSLVITESIITINTTPIARKYIAHNPYGSKIAIGDETRFSIPYSSSSGGGGSEIGNNQILFYENFEDLSDLNWETVKPLWNGELVGCYINGSQSLTYEGGDRSYVWESTFHDGYYGGQDGYDINCVFDTVIYDDAVCESMWLWAEVGWTGTSKTGYYSGKIAHGIVGGWQVHGDWYGEGIRFQTVWTSVDRLRGYLYYPLIATGAPGPALGGVPSGDTVIVPEGYWMKYSKCVKLNTPGVDDGIVAFFENDTLVYYNDTSTLRLNYSDPDSIYGIGGLYVKYMWGGSGPNYTCDGDNTIKSDDFLVWMDVDFPSSFTVGETILTEPDYPESSVYMTKTFYADSTYTAATDSIYPTKITKNKLLPDDQSNIWTVTIEGSDLNITFETYDIGYIDSPSYRVSYVKVYTVVGEVRTLQYEFGRGQADGSPAIGVPYSMEASEVQIDYFIGSDFNYWKISYDND